MPWKIVQRDNSFCVHKLNADDSLGEFVTCHGSMEEAEAHMRALYVNVTEIEPPAETEPVVETDNNESTNGGQDEPKLELISEIGLMETKMQKGFPDVPFAEGVSLEEIKKHDATPTFITLQIAEIGKKSRAGILYDEPLVNVIEQHIIQKRPGGIFGHPNPNNADFEFPDPQAFWVGAKREGNILWGKAWIRDPQSARRVRDTGKVGGTLGTSIWGRAIKEARDGAIRLKDFMLERIDFAPLERASLPLSGQFALTAEMDTSTGEHTVTPEELKAELAKLTPDVVVGLLTADTYTRIGEMVAKKNEVLGAAGEQELISEMTAQLNTANALISEMTKERDTLKETLKQRDASLFDHDVDATVRWATDWNTTTEPGKKNLKALRAYLKKALVAEMNPGEPMKDAMERVMNDDQYKPVIEMTKKEIGGGALTTQVVDQRAAQFIKPTDDQIADARSRLGI